LSVTVHVVAPPEVMLTGLQPSDSTLRTGMTVTVVEVLPPSDAVTVAVCAAATEAAVAVNAMADDPAGTVTDAGTGRAALFDASDTTPPPAGAF
jgi:hypothetical protein